VLLICRVLQTVPLTNMLTDLPTTFDWRNNNVTVVTPVKNQGQCGRYVRLVPVHRIVLVH
jgi:hypothetical protein